MDRFGSNLTHSFYEALLKFYYRSFDNTSCDLRQKYQLFFLSVVSERKTLHNAVTENTQ